MKPNKEGLFSSHGQNTKNIRQLLSKSTRYGSYGQEAWKFQVLNENSIQVNLEFCCIIELT